MKYFLNAISNTIRDINTVIHPVPYNTPKVTPDDFKKWSAENFRKSSYFVDLNKLPKFTTLSGKIYYRAEAHYSASAKGTSISPMFTNNGELVMILVTDCIFDVLTPETQTFVLKHEEGHVENDDIVKAVAAINSDDFNPFSIFYMLKNLKILTRNVDTEAAADLYAARIVGKEVAVQALTEMYDILRYSGWGANDELKQRIRIMKKANI